MRAIRICRFNKLLLHSSCCFEKVKSQFKIKKYGKFNKS